MEYSTTHTPTLRHFLQLCREDNIEVWVSDKRIKNTKKTIYRARVEESTDLNDNAMDFAFVAGMIPTASRDCPYCGQTPKNHDEWCINA